MKNKTLVKYKRYEEDNVIDQAENIYEDVSLPINKNDIIFYGKFKNKKGVVSDIIKNEKGDYFVVLDSGKQIPLLRVRLGLGEEVHLSDLKKNAFTSDFTKDWIEIRRKIRGAGNISSKVHSIKINRKKDYVTVIFKSKPTYSNLEPSVDAETMTFKGNVKAYTQMIRFYDFFAYAKTKPNYNEAELTLKEMKEILRVCSIKLNCDCPSFTMQGLSFYLTQLDGSIFNNNIKPKRWNKYHDRKGDLGLVCKHLSMITNSIDFWINPMTSMINKYLKKKRGSL